MGKSMEELDANPNPWYREPWPWILMSGPAIVMVACIITIYLAFSTGADEAMGGAVRRGLIVEVLQERSLGKAPAVMSTPTLQEQKAEERANTISAQPNAAE